MSDLDPTKILKKWQKCKQKSVKISRFVNYFLTSSLFPHFLK